MNVSQPKQVQGLGCCSGGSDQETLVERAQVEPPVEAIAERGEVACRVLSKVERMVATRQTGLEIAEDGVDPLELGNLLGLASCHDGWVMTAAGRCDGSKASQSIGEHHAAWHQMKFRPNGNGLEREPRDGRQPDAQRTILIGQRDGRDEGHLVFGAASDLAAGTLATEVGVINLDFAFKQIAIFTVGHRLHQLVLDQPGGG